MNILEAILNAQGGGAASNLGRQFGLDGQQTQSALSALLPALAGAMTQNAQAPGGMEALLGALQGGQHSRYLDDPASLGDPRTVQDGNGILGHLFGSKEVSREVAARASQQTGIGSDILKQMLPVVAAMVMGGLSRGSAPPAAPGGMGGLGGNTAGGLGGLAGLAGALLGGGRAPGASGGQGAGGLLDMLTPMLDRNRDGSALDDVLGMAASFLKRR